jgi:hypothetical protein
MDSSKGVETSFNDDKQDDGNEEEKGSSSNETSAETPPFLFEPKMCSLFLSFCDFEELLALRSMNKALKGFIDQEGVTRALQALPLKSSFVKSNDDQSSFQTSMEVSLGWRGVDHSSREAMADQVIARMEREPDFHQHDGDENHEDEDHEGAGTGEWKNKAKEALIATGEFYTLDIDGSNNSDGSKTHKTYIQRPYAGYTKDISTRRSHRGAAIILEDSISLDKALKLVNMMTCSLTDAEALTYNYWTSEPDTAISVLKQHILCLLLMGPASSICHGYFAYRGLNKYTTSTFGGRSGALQFRLSSCQEIEIVFSSYCYD